MINNKKRKNTILLTIFTLILLLASFDVVKADDDPKIIGNLPTIISDFTYDGEKHQIAIGGSLGATNGGKVTYAINGDWKNYTDIGYITDVGEYILEYRGENAFGDVFAGPYTIGTVKVFPAVNKFVEVPSVASNFEYDGKEHPLFTSLGKDEQGKNINYSYSFNGERSQSYTSIPTIKNAGTYDVYSETSGITPNYTSTKSDTKRVIVSPKQLNDVTVTVSGTYTYNTKEQQVKIEKVTSTSFGEISKDDYEVISSTDRATNAGEYILKIKGKRNFSFNAEAKWTINKLDISNATLTLGPQLYFTGNTQTKEVNSVKVNNLTLPQNDYVISGNKQKDVGTYSLTVSGTNKNTTGSKNASYTIEPFTITNNNIDITLGPQLIYNEKEQTQTISKVTIKATGAVINPAYYDVTKNKGTNAGKYTLIITGKQNIKGSASKDWTILKCTVTGTWSKSEFDYDGKEHSVVLEGLPKCADVSYKNNKAIKPGDYRASATITIKNNDNYVVGKVKDLDWKINKLKYDMSKVKFESKIFPYDGKEHSIEITGELPKGVTVTYKNNKLTNVGVKQATAIFKGDEVHEPIKDLHAEIKVLNNAVLIPKEDNTIFVENGKEQTYKIEENEHYSVKNNVQVKAGEYKVVVSLNDPKNYIWEDNTIEDKIYNFVIRKREIHDKDNEITLINEEVGFDIKASLRILYTEKKTDEDYKHLIDVKSLLKPHQDMNFAYLIEILNNNEIGGTYKVKVKINDKFVDKKFNLINVSKDGNASLLDYKLENEGKEVNLTTSNIDEFIFLNNNKGAKVHLLKILIITAFVILNVVYYFVLKYRKYNVVNIAATILYVFSYVIFTGFFNCGICITLDSVALIALIASYILFNKNKLKIFKKVQTAKQ